MNEHEVESATRHMTFGIGSWSGRQWPRGAVLQQTNKQTHLSKNAGDYVIIIDITRRGEKVIRIIHIYDQRARETGERPARRLDCQKIIWQGGGGTVLTGDFNTHSLRRDPRCTECREATYWAEIIDEYGLAIGNNDRPTHYWTRNQSEGVSIMDLTLANQWFGK